MGELVGSAPVLWALAMLDGPDRQVSGFIGPFASVSAANGYATNRNYADWRVVPAVWRTERDSSVGVETL